jgi:radical SAM superfamily enzyme YgiQ (UPF0313 family)
MSAGLSACVRTPSCISPYLDHPAAFIPFRTRTGCKGSCSFCVEAEKKEPVSIIDPTTIARQLKLLADEHPSAVFFLCDGEMNRPDADHATKTALALASLDAPPVWRGYACPAPFPEALARAVAATPVMDLHLNVVHVNDDVLRINKIGHVSRQVHEAMELLEKHRIPFSLSVLAGLPGETENSLVELISFLENVPCRAVFSAGALIYPDAPLENMAQSEPQYVHYSKPGLFAPRVFCRPYSPEETFKRLAETQKKNPRVMVINAGQEIPIRVQWARRHLEAGNALANRMILDRAVRFYRDALQADPGCEPAKINLASIERLFNDKGDAP